MVRLLCTAGLIASVGAFVPRMGAPTDSRQGKSIRMHEEGGDFARRDFLGLGLATGLAAFAPSANAVVYLDPAMYGDQELRVAAVNKVRTRVRTEMLQDPTLGTAFLQLAILDALSYNDKTDKGGPDGSVIAAIQRPKPEYQNMQKAAKIILDSKVEFKKTNALTIADLVALSGAEAIEAIGGPELPVQLGRTDSRTLAKEYALAKEGKFDTVPALAVDFADSNSAQVFDAFKRSGMTERELAVIMGALTTLQSLELSAEANYKVSGRGKAVERGKIGRARDFRPIEDEEFAAADEMDMGYDDDTGDNIFIVDSFGTRGQAFGKSVSGGLDPKQFNQVMKQVNKKGYQGGDNFYERTLLFTPGAKSWIDQYSSSNLKFQKDLKTAYNAMTQLGGVYTGGKYAALLEGRERRTLE